VREPRQPRPTGDAGLRSCPSTQPRLRPANGRLAPPAGLALRSWIRGQSLLIAAEKPHGVFSGKKVMAGELFRFAVGGHPVLLGGPQAAAPDQERQVGLDGPTVILERRVSRARRGAV